MPHSFITPELKKIDPSAYHFFGLWRQSLFSACFWAYCWSDEVIKKLGITSKESGVFILTQGNFFLKKSEIENIRKQLYAKIDAHDGAFFQNMVDVADSYFKEAVAFGETFKDKDITPENFTEFTVFARRIIFLWMLGAEQFSEIAQAKLADIAVTTSFPAENISQVIPVFETPLNCQHKEVMVLKKEVGGKSLEDVRKDKALYAKFEDHARRFAWIEIANFVGESLTVERLYEQIIHAKDEPLTQAKKIKDVPPQVAFAAECLSRCGYIRQAGAEYFFMLSEKALPYLKSIAKKLGLSYEEFLFQRDSEILEALKGDISLKDLRENAVRRAKNEYALFTGIGFESFFTEELRDIEILKKEMLPRAEAGATHLKGEIGNKGKYTGPVRIIMDTNDFHKMLPGDVLVSTMTTPNFVVLMHKAGAIVTDIGGMLCHAAIVSREIGKPCVIGTKVATKALKDGDMIEVDADKGVVNILKRAS